MTFFFTGYEKIVLINTYFSFSTTLTAWYFCYFSVVLVFYSCNWARSSSFLENVFLFLCCFFIFFFLIFMSTFVFVSRSKSSICTTDLRATRWRTRCNLLITCARSRCTSKYPEAVIFWWVSFALLYIRFGVGEILEHFSDMSAAEIFGLIESR